MKEKVVILGAGIAGCIAYHALRDKKPLIVEIGPQVERFETHRAIMRLRNDDVADFLGAEAEEVMIHKGIYDYEDGFVGPSILVNNLYSIKLYGELGIRSILKPGSQKRFILPDGFPIPENIRFNSKVVAIKPGIITLHTGDIIKYEHCVSTLPMPVIKEIAKPNFPDKINFEYKPVFVKRFKLKINSSVHQTVYIPNMKIHQGIYRVTIQNQDVIFESVLAIEMWEVELIMNSAFGINKEEYELCDSSTIKMGKIKSINENARLKFIFWLTDQFNVYSFGRYSVWKPLRTDELLDDMMKVKKIIRAKGSKQYYLKRIIRNE